MSKFFEAVKRTDMNLGGMSLPFTDEEISVADAAAASPEHEPAAQAFSRSAAPPEGYRNISIRVPLGAPILPFDGSHMGAAEHYRMIRTKIVQHPSKPQVLCVSSTSIGDGKTVNSLNIACSLALKQDTKVLLVDVDLRRSQLAGLLGIPEAPGLAELLAGSCTLQDAIVQIADLPSLYLLPAGRCPTNPTELLDSEVWRGVTETFRKTFDFTVMDSPPVGMVADYDLIETVCDGIVLVTRPGHSNRRMLQEGISQMPKDKFLGVVVNCVEPWFLWHPRSSYYGNYYSKPA
jgi:capsular exopolysaccharide synthesis family protein